MLRVLSNLPLPSGTHAVKTFGDYRPFSASGPWKPEYERRALGDILPLIPQAEKPDVLICSSPEYLPIPCDVAAFPGIRILLITDWNMCLRFLPEVCGLFDYCFIDWPGYRLLCRAGVANVHHQPMFGHDPAIFRMQEGQRNLDVSFCGNLNAGLHRERNRLLARLGKWGAARNIHLGQAFGQDYVAILARSRLVFNYSIRGEANMRLYEAMACGAVPLVEAGNQEVPILFQPDRHYFPYHPQHLEARLESLLADPARIEAVSREAVAAVAAHTKARQIQSLLDFAGRDRPARPNPGWALPPAEVGSADAPAPGIPRTGASAGYGSAPVSAGKALVKMRVLGAAYTLAEAISELQARDRDLPGLAAESLPAALLELLEGNPRDTLAAVNALLERLLEGPGIPAPARALLHTRLHAARGQWQESLAWTERCLADLAAGGSDSPAAGPEAARYGFFLPPIGLGKGMNTDLNRAFREDLDSGSQRGYLGLLRAHALSARARALLSLNRLEEARECAEGIPKNRWVSLDPYLLLHEVHSRMDDRARLRELLPAWFAENPLDWTMWDKVAESLIRIDDRPSLIGFLEELLTLARHFLTPDQGEAIRARLRQERARA